MRGKCSLLIICSKLFILNSDLSTASTSNPNSCKYRELRPEPQPRSSAFPTGTIWQADITSECVFVI